MAVARNKCMACGKAVSEHSQDNLAACEAYMLKQGYTNHTFPDRASTTKIVDTGPKTGHDVFKAWDAHSPIITTNSDERKGIPLATGVIDYFPDALIEVARLSKFGNDKHNPGQPLHWARGKSDDHPDCLMRHFVERGTVDTDGIRHSAKVAWRALAILQLELEEAAKAGSGGRVAGSGGGGGGAFVAYREGPSATAYVDVAGVPTRLDGPSV